MNLDQLLHFTKVAEHGSFSRAALSLDMSQPAVSRSVRQLEVDLRKTLFHRHGRGIALTHEGAKLLELATNVLEQLESVHMVDSDDDRDLKGRMIIGLPPSLGRVLSADLVREFYARFPQARLAVVEGFSRDLHDRVAADKIDAAILLDPPTSSLVTVEPIVRQPMCLVTARKGAGDESDGSSPITLADVSQRRLLMPTAPNSLRMLIEAEATRRGLALDICCEMDGIASLLKLVREGFGDTIATADFLLRMNESDTLTVRPIVDPVVECVVSLATPSRARPTQLQARATELLRDVARTTILH